MVRKAFLKTDGELEMIGRKLILRKRLQLAKELDRSPPFSRYQEKAIAHSVRNTNTVFHEYAEMKIGVDACILR